MQLTIKKEPLRNEYLESKRKSKSTRNSLLFKEVSNFLGLVFIVVFFTIITKGRTVSFANLKLMGLQSIILIIGGLGATFTLSHGTIDFSLGGVLGMSATAGALAGILHPSLILPVCILAGLVTGVFMAGVHITTKIPTIIVGLAMMFVGRGITTIVGMKRKLNLPVSLNWMDNYWVYFSFLIIVLILAYILFEFTKVGKYNKAMGSNMIAAKMSGIPLSRYKIYAFIISGITVGICAFLSMLRTGSVDIATGRGFELNVLICLVLGGASLTGGTKIKLRGVIAGVLILTVLENGLIMWGIDVNIIGVVRGILFLVVVGLSYDRQKGESEQFFMPGL